ncbi:hypothetical protein LTR85_001353 [Meristemomyces frigidus]|nr:hypothetical protein LTR85_001353 [Meristemomyces frigidus]
MPSIQEPSGAPQQGVQQESRLLNPPAELRNRIYEYVACSEAPRLGCDRVIGPDLTFGRTSHQIRDELLAVFHTFLRQQTAYLHVDVDDPDFGNLGRLVDRLRPLANGEKQRVKVLLLLSKKAAGGNFDELKQ